MTWPAKDRSKDLAAIKRFDEGKTMSLSDEERAMIKAYQLFPDVVDHDYALSPGTPRHPGGKIVSDLGPLRYAYVLGFRHGQETSQETKP